MARPDIAEVPSPTMTRSDRSDQRLPAVIVDLRFQADHPRLETPAPLQASRIKLPQLLTRAEGAAALRSHRS